MRQTGAGLDSEDVLNIVLDGLCAADWCWCSWGWGLLAHHLGYGMPCVPCVSCVLPHASAPPWVGCPLRHPFTPSTHNRAPHPQTPSANRACALCPVPCRPFAPNGDSYPPPCPTQSCPLPAPMPCALQAFCTSLNWLSNLVVGSTFPAMLAALGIAGAPRAHTRPAHAHVPMPLCPCPCARALVPMPMLCHWGAGQASCCPRGWSAAPALNSPHVGLLLPASQPASSW